MAFMVPGRTLAFQHGSASLGFKDGTQIPPVFTAHKDGYLKQGTANLCKASLLKPAALPACVCKMCGKGCLCAHQAVCVFACAPFLAGVYVSALIWQALLGCRQAGSWIMAPALLAGRTHLKQQQVENAFFFFFFLLCCLSFCPGWDMAVVQIGKSCGRFGKCLFSPLTLSLPSLCVIIDWREVTFKMKSRSVRKNVKAFMLSHGININSLSPPPVPLPLCLLSTSVSFLSSLSLSLTGCALSLSVSFLSLPLCSLFTLGLPECVFASVCCMPSINKRDRKRGFE